MILGEAHRTRAELRCAVVSVVLLLVGLKDINCARSMPGQCGKMKNVDFGMAGYGWVGHKSSTCRFWALTSTRPRTATVPVKRDGEMVIIPVAELVPGDVTLGR